MRLVRREASRRCPQARSRCVWSSSLPFLKVARHGLVRRNGGPGLQDSIEEVRIRRADKREVMTHADLPRKRIRLPGVLDGQTSTMHGHKLQVLRRPSRSILRDERAPAWTTAHAGHGIDL